MLGCRVETFSCGSREALERFRAEVCSSEQCLGRLDTKNSSRRSAVAPVIVAEGEVMAFGSRKGNECQKHKSRGPWWRFRLGMEGLQTPGRLVAATIERR